jgi:cytochrome P450
MQKQRKDLMPAFHVRHVKDLYPVFWEKARELVERVAAQADTLAASSDNHTKTIEVNSWASRAALDIIGVAGMGKDFCSLADPDSTLNQTYRKIFTPGRAGQILGLLRLFLPIWVIRRIP